MTLLSSVNTLFRRYQCLSQIGGTALPNNEVTTYRAMVFMNFGTVRCTYCKNILTNAVIFLILSWNTFTAPVNILTFTVVTNYHCL